MTDFLVTATWRDDVGREAVSKQYVAMTVPSPDADAAQDFFDALQAASTASLRNYSVRRHGIIASITAAASSPYSVKDRLILAFKAVTGGETMRIGVPVPKNAVFNDDETCKVDQVAVAALIAYLEANMRTVSGILVKFTGGWRGR